MQTRTIIILLLAVMNIVSFLFMAWDKRCARRKLRRIRERTLFLAAGLFGALGGVMGMFLCHHKTRHWYFRYGFPLMLLAQAVVLALLWTHMPA